MIQDLTKYVDFLVEHQITPKQFLLPYCLFLEKLEDKENGRWYRQVAGKNRPAANMYKYASTVETWTFDDIEVLVDRGFIVNKGDVADSRRKNKGDFPENLEVTPKFISLIFATETEFEEFWNLYPSYVDNFNDPLHGAKIPLKLVSYEEMEELYNKNIKTTIEHSRMMRALRWAVENDQIRFRIDKFLKSRHWQALEELMEESDGGETGGKGSIRGKVV